MMPVVYCIGCIYYQKYKKIWCSHSNPEKCMHKELYKSKEEKYGNKSISN